MFVKLVSLLLGIGFLCGNFSCEANINTHKEPLNDKKFRVSEYSCNYKWPLNKKQIYKITCAGYYKNGKKHSCRYYSGGKFARDTIPYGIDIAVPQGTKIYAPENGVVRNISFHGGGLGFHFEILHPDGNRTLYGHLKYYGYVYEGKFVKRGQLIALTGNSGKSTGPHLHFEMSNYNPIEYYGIEL